MAGFGIAEIIDLIDGLVFLVLDWAGLGSRFVGRGGIEWTYLSTLGR